MTGNENNAHLQDEINELKRRVYMLEQLFGVNEQIEKASHPADTVLPVSQPVIQQPVAVQNISVPTPPAAVNNTNARSASSVHSEPRSTEGLESEFGGNWLNKIGAVALVLGMIFFLKYAIDNRWINETGRVMIGIIVGIACIYGGEYFQKKNLPRYAQGISGAGIAILYGSIYVASAFYQLIPQSFAFAFMFLVTAAAIAISIRHDAVAISVLGIVGAFLTPILLNSSGGSGDSGVKLLTYIAVIDLGVLILTYFKGWRTLNLLSYFGTVLLFAGWWWDSPEWQVDSENAVRATALTFATIFFAIFAAQSFVQNVIARRNLNASDVILVVFTPALYLAAVYGLLPEKYHIYLGLIMVVLAGLYLAFAQRITIARYEDKRLRILFLVITTCFITFAIPVQFDGYWVTIGWAVEAAVVAALGLALQSSKTRYASTAFLGFSVFHLLAFDGHMHASVPIANARFLTFLAVTAVIVAMAWLYHKYKDTINPEEKIMPMALVLAANFVLIWALSIEAATWASAYSISLALSGVWTLYGLIMLVCGIIWKYRAVRIMGLSLLGIVIAKTFIYDVWMLERLYRIIAFISLGVALLLASYFYQTHRDKIKI